MSHFKLTNLGVKQDCSKLHRTRRNCPADVNFEDSLRNFVQREVKRLEASAQSQRRAILRGVLEIWGIPLVLAPAT